jgi:UDP-N-acetylmuramyl pentapeptide phosphotransferase/UDP-N-acetylglucosamine-1-phosphate transferase
MTAFVAIVAIAWVTNLFNFMDGADGLAGGMAAIGFAACAWAAIHSGDTALAGTCAAIASASVGFLRWNFPPARVFLGDAGSIPLGFLAAALGAYGAVRGTWSLAFPVMVFSPFIVDATVTLLRRLVGGEKVWRAHRSHYYQRLVLAGWPRRRLAVASFALMAGAGASALVLERVGAMLQCGIIFFWAALYALLLVSIDRTTRRMR